MKKYFVLFLILLLSLTINNNINVQAKKRVTKGRFYKSNVMWSYNKNTSTMTIKPATKKVKKEHYKDYLYWKERTKNLIHKDGMKDLWFYCYSDGGEYDNNTLESAYFPGSIKRIESESYDAASALKEITLSEGIEYIGKDAFRYASLNEVKLPKGLKYIGGGAFAGVFGLNSGEIYFNDDLQYIGAYAFGTSCAQSFSVPDSVSYIGAYAFDGCYNLREIRLPKRLRTIEEALFSLDNRLEQCDIPESVVVIKDRAFDYTGIQDITIPRNVEILGSQGENLGIFRDCNKLKRIRIESRKLKVVNKGALCGIPNSVTIEVPRGYKDAYKAMFDDSGMPGNYSIIEIDVDDSDDAYLRLDRDSIVTKKGLNRKLELMYADNPEEIVWSSLDDTIASVNQEGIISAKEIGDTKITALYKGKTFECSVKVKSKDSNNDVKALKKLIKKQNEFDTYISSKLYKKDGDYLWENGRLTGIYWNGTCVHGVIDLNEFTYLKYFECSGMNPCVTGIEASDLKNLEYIECDADVPDENIHVENSKNVKIYKESAR